MFRTVSMVHWKYIYVTYVLGPTLCYGIKDRQQEAERVLQYLTLLCNNICLHINILYMK